MNTKDIYLYTHPKRLSRKESSVHYGSTRRFDKSKEQADLPIVSLDKIIRIVNDFLEIMGVNKVENPKFHLDKKIEEIYADIKGNYALNNINHMVWLKFTKDGYLGVVAGSNDVNFNMPPDSASYNDTSNGKGKSSNNRWKYNTSGIIVHSLNKEWDDSFTLIFPLVGIGDGLRKDIECGVGNYLIKQGVPILDYYSHRFQ